MRWGYNVSGETRVEGTTSDLPRLVVQHLRTCIAYDIGPRELRLTCMYHMVELTNDKKMYHTSGWSNGWISIVEWRYIFWEREIIGCTTHYSKTGGWCNLVQFGKIPYRYVPPHTTARTPSPHANQYFSSLHRDYHHPLPPHKPVVNPPS